MLGFVLSLLIAFQGAGTPVADDDDTTLEEELRAAPVYDGQQALAVREFQIIGDAPGESGIVLLQSTVRFFRVSAQAEDALAESVVTNLESGAFANVEEQDPPGFDDESQAFTGELANGGFVGLVFVARDDALYRFVAVSMTEDPLPELLVLVDGWLDAAEVTDDIYDLLPTLDDVPDGFTLTKQGRITYDGEPDTATPAA
jgi:hypothetical protein